MYIRYSTDVTLVVDSISMAYLVPVMIGETIDNLQRNRNVIEPDSINSAAFMLFTLFFHLS